MINVSDIVADADLAAPQPFGILRSSGQWVLGKYQSVISTISAVGPVQRAGDKEVLMLPEADRVGAVMAFWWTEPIYETNANRPVLVATGQIPQGTIPGTVYTLTNNAPGTLTLNGITLFLNLDYTLDSTGTIITLHNPTSLNDELYYDQQTVKTVIGQGSGESDILVYPADSGLQYRVLAVRHYPGSGYWRALGTRMRAT